MNSHKSLVGGEKGLIVQNRHLQLVKMRLCQLDIVKLFERIDSENVRRRTPVEMSMLDDVKVGAVKSREK
jgi:hypothetical protein